MGTPCSVSGTSPNSNFSLKPAIKTIARVKPIPTPSPNTTLVIKLYPFNGIKSARPKIAQLVVISGKNIPRALYKTGLDFLINISTNCTKEAITMIKETYLKKGRLKASSIYVLINQVAAAVKVITKVVAIPILKAVSTCLETPKKGQIPKNLTKIKLLIKTVLIKTSTTTLNSSINYPSF